MKKEPKFPKVFPMKVGDVLELERQTIYEQRQQSFKVTKRTIKSIEEKKGFSGARIVFVKFKECPSKTYVVEWNWTGAFSVRGSKSRYDVQNVFWHNEVVDFSIG